LAATRSFQWKIVRSGPGSQRALVDHTGQRTTLFAELTANFAGGNKIFAQPGTSLPAELSLTKHKTEDCSVRENSQRSNLCLPGFVRLFGGFEAPKIPWKPGVFAQQNARKTLRKLNRISLVRGTETLLI